MNKPKLFRPFSSTQYLKKGGFKVFYIDQSNVASISQFLKPQYPKRKFPRVPSIKSEQKALQDNSSSNYQELQIQERKSQQMPEQIQKQRSQIQFQGKLPMPHQIRQKITEIIKMNAAQRSQIKAEEKKQANKFRQKVQNVIKSMANNQNGDLKKRNQQQSTQCQNYEQAKNKKETKLHDELRGIQIGKAIIRKNGKKARQKPIILKPKAKQQSNSQFKEKKDQYPKFSIMQEYQQQMYGQTFNKQRCERITRNKIRQNSFGQANFIQLEIKPKFNKQAAEIYKIRDKLKSKQGSGCADTPYKKKTKKIKKTQENQQQFQSILNKKQKAILNEILVHNLPPRNPSTKHQHNCVDSAQIALKTILKDNKLYFASDLLHYNKASKVLNIKSGPRFSSFIEQTLKSSQSCKNINQVPHDSLIKKIKLKRNFEYTNKKTLVLDLDETLVHSQGLNEQADKHIFPFSFEFDKTTRHYTIRNYAKEFIRNLAQTYYIVVFTSAVQGYADNILEHIDPEEKYIQHRLYRSNCYLHGQKFPYIKDLRILNRDLSQIIIVDNSLYAFWFNIDNGVPITSFTGVQDQELRKLERYLLMLEDVDDVRKVNRRAFHLHLYQEHQGNRDLLRAYCDLMRKEVDASVDEGQQIVEM